MTHNTNVCDQCKQPIEAKKGKISFQPLRGGLTITVANDVGNAGLVINQQVDLCNDTCLGNYIAAIRAKIKPPTPPQPPAPAPAVK